jgi:hypothetical protein
MDARPSALSRAGWISAVAVVLTASAVPVSADTPESITVQAQREREKLEHDVNMFVSTAIAQSHYDESLERWTYAPVCPLVAGVSKELGEFVLARVSQIARTAGAPLGAEKCKSNFFVIVSPDDPAPRLTKLTHKNGGQLFNYETGEELKKFVEISRPVRVWYNTGATSIDGASMMSELFDTGSEHAKTFNNSRGPEPIHNSLPYDAMSPLFLAVIEATEEAIYNSMFKATTVTGNGHTVEALPIEKTVEILKEHRVLK